MFSFFDRRPHIRILLLFLWLFSGSIYPKTLVNQYLFDETRAELIEYDERADHAIAEGKQVELSVLTASCRTFVHTHQEDQQQFLQEIREFVHAHHSCVLAVIFYVPQKSDEKNSEYALCDDIQRELALLGVTQSRICTLLTSQEAQKSEILFFLSQ